MAPKVWLITGASSGFGLIMTQLVLEGGDKCVATSIEPQALEPLAKQYTSQLLSLYADVTKPEQIQAAFRSAKEKFGGIDVVFSNAGTAMADEVENTPDEKARMLFEVNFWGVVTVMKESIKMFRDGNPPGRGGRLLQMASVAGIVGFPALGYYVASKHAVVGLTKTLVQELKPEWNIQVTIVEPGFFKTNILNVVKEAETVPTEAYTGGPAAQNRKAMEPENIKGDPKKAMQLAKKVAEMDKMPLHLPIGGDAIGWVKGSAEELQNAVADWEVEATNTLF